MASHILSSVTHLCLGTAGFSDLSVRVDELAAHPPPGSRVLVVENEITYLALPECADAIAIFGEGYAAARLSELPWLADRDAVYWGDIDTYGFAILDQVRARLPGVRSLLMDDDTLLAHEAHWAVEAKRHEAELLHLNPAESALYGRLLNDEHGVHVRLEQERVRFHHVHDALAHLGWRPD